MTWRRIRTFPVLAAFATVRDLKPSMYSAHLQGRIPGDNQSCSVLHLSHNYSNLSGLNFPYQHPSRVSAVIQPKPLRFSRFYRMFHSDLLRTNAFSGHWAEPCGYITPSVSSSLALPRNIQPTSNMSPTNATPSLSTLTVHGDDDVNKIPSALQQEVSDVAPALHVSTTFRYSRNPDELVEAKDCDVSLLSPRFGAMCAELP